MRIQSKGFELPTPLGWRITQPLDSNAANGLDRSAHEVWCEECQRDRHVDLTHAALFTRCDLLNVGHGARNDLVTPATTSGDSADAARATFAPRWADFIFGNAVRYQDSPRSPGWRLLRCD